MIMHRWLWRARRPWLSQTRLGPLYSLAPHPERTSQLATVLYLLGIP